MKSNSQRIGLALILCMAVIGAQASTIANYGDFHASSVTYKQVTENTDIGAYQAPNVTMATDTIDFNPFEMLASSAGGGAVTNNALLNFDVQADSGKYIQGLVLNESGDLTVLPSGTDATFADVSANFTVTIKEVNGVSLSTPLTETYSMTFDGGGDGTHGLVSDGFTIGKAWTGDALFLDFVSILLNNGYTVEDGATLANIDLENVLIASSEAGSSASIHKKDTGALSISAQVIPEPASAVLLVGAGSLLTLIRRRFIV